MATAEDAIEAPVDHSTPKQVLNPKIFGREHEDHHERKSLHTLQPSALDDTALVGVGVKLTQSSKCIEKTRFKPIPGPVKVFHDSDDVRDNSAGRTRMYAMESRSTQTDNSLLEDLIQQRLKESCKRNHSSLVEEENEAYELMVKEPVPESYWKEVAEQRRLALNDTLEENKSLHESLESFKEENERLLEVASRAEQLSSLLQSVVSDEEDTKEEDENADTDTKEEDQNADTDTKEDQNADTDAGGTGDVPHSDQPVISEAATAHKSQNPDVETESSKTCDDQTKSADLKD